MILETSLWQFFKFTFIDLHLPIWQEIGSGVPPGKSLTVTPPICPHMKESAQCPYEKVDTPLVLKNTPLPHLHGGTGYHVYIYIYIYIYITEKTLNVFISLYFRTLLILMVFHQLVFPLNSNIYLIITW